MVISIRMTYYMDTAKKPLREGSRARYDHFGHLSITFSTSLYARSPRHAGGSMHARNLIQLNGIMDILIIFPLIINQLCMVICHFDSDL